MSLFKFCGHCKYKFVNLSKQPCKECLGKPAKPNWVERSNHYE